MRYSAKQYAEALHAAIGKLHGAERAEAIGRFLRIMKRSGDHSKLDEILAAYEKIAIRADGMVKAEVRTPSGLSPAVRRAVEEALGRPAVIVEKVDPELLAGIEIVLNDSLAIDATAKSKLNKIRSK
jgi:F0F1-type ATP synthase delta subunit